MRFFHFRIEKLPIAILLFTLIVNDVIEAFYDGYRHYRRSSTSLNVEINSIFKRFSDKFERKVDKELKSDTEELLDFVDYKPWRAPKIKNLKYHYKPQKDTYQERYRTEDDDTVYLYALPSFRTGWDKTRVDDLWNFPWLWSKIKAERLSWIHKIFYADVYQMGAQEHIEMDTFFSEFDMPMRWGLLRLKEFDVLNGLGFWIVFLWDFNGIKPTDLGLRPDGSLRTCPVQFHNCISSSNSPNDAEHYAPPLRWSRGKSPEQAFDEVKQVYEGYPKRGLKWSSGWIDRGGFNRVLFSGPYFYATGESLTWRYLDDVELLLNTEKREVSIRSSTRLGQSDWDVERLRYNQLARMLDKKGGWESAPLPRDYFLLKTPFRWTQKGMDKVITTTEKSLDALANKILTPTLAGTYTDDAENTQGAARRAFAEAVRIVDPYVQPIITATEDLEERVRLDPRVAAAMQVLDEWYTAIQGTATDLGLGTEAANYGEMVKEYVTKLQGLLDLPMMEDMNQQSPDEKSEEAGSNKESQLPIEDVVTNPYIISPEANEFNADDPISGRREPATNAITSSSSMEQGTSADILVPTSTLNSATSPSQKSGSSRTPGNRFLGYRVDKSNGRSNGIPPAIKQVGDLQLSRETMLEKYLLQYPEELESEASSISSKTSSNSKGSASTESLRSSPRVSTSFSGKKNNEKKLVAQNVGSKLKAGHRSSSNYLEDLIDFS